MELKRKRGNMSYDDIKKLLEENNQEQLLKYYDELNDTQKANLLDQISKLDFSLIDLIKNKEHSGDTTCNQCIFQSGTHYLHDINFLGKRRSNSCVGDWC